MIPVPDLSTADRIRVMEQLMQLLRALKAWPFGLIRALIDHPQARYAAQYAIEHWAIDLVLGTLRAHYRHLDVKLTPWDEPILPWLLAADADKALAAIRQKDQACEALCGKKLERAFSEGAVAVIVVHANRQEFLLVCRLDQVNSSSHEGQYHWNLWGLGNEFLAGGMARRPSDLAQSIHLHILP